jgi:hypothetical protein
MLPNKHHPGPGCSCSDCLRAFPEPDDEISDGELAELDELDYLAGDGE